MKYKICENNFLGLLREVVLEFKKYKAKVKERELIKEEEIKYYKKKSKVKCTHSEIDFYWENGKRYWYCKNKDCELNKKENHCTDSNWSYHIPK